VGRLLREAFLQQSAFSDDAYCPLPKQIVMLRSILAYYDALCDLIQRGRPFAECIQQGHPLRRDLFRMKEMAEDALTRTLPDLLARIDDWRRQDFR
jgi:vacuolar-type H+-ATPase catalytic subunit A/Vma1